jgi:hypothetical protein
MGADLCLTGVPVVDLTPERLSELEAIIDRLTDRDFEETAPPRADSMAEWQAQLRTAVKILDGIDELRDVSRWYGWWLSGGLSWGEDPTESFTNLALIYDCDPLLTKLLSWSQDVGDAAGISGPR